MPIQLSYNMNDLPNDLIRLILGAAYSTRMPHMMMVCKKWNEIIIVSSEPTRKIDIMTRHELLKWYRDAYGPNLVRGILKTANIIEKYAANPIVIWALAELKITPCRHMIQLWLGQNKVELLDQNYETVAATPGLMAFATVAEYDDAVSYLKSRKYKEDMSGCIYDTKLPLPHEHASHTIKLMKLLREIISCIKYGSEMAIKSLPNRVCINDESAVK